MAEKFPLMTYVTGILARLNANSRKPTAYLYNGVRLPKLPEWDREMYPYAFLYKYNSYTYLNCTTHRPFFSDGKFCMVNPSISFVLENDAFTDKRENGLDNLVFGSTEDKLQLIWTNFDVLNDDGSVYMAAGYTNYPDAPPVLPVTEAADPCPDKSVMYLYDNAATDEVGDTVMLPAIPEIDRRVYPYFALCSQGKRSTFGSDPEWMAVASRYPLNEYVNNDRYRHHVYCFIDETDSTKWGQWVKDEGIHGPLEGCNVDAWANHDVYDYDGNRVISASDPIPVYDKE